MADVKKINGYDIKDETARNGLLTKQDKLTSANAGDNITIEEVEGVVKISAEAGLPAGEPNSLYGTDGEGNAVAYKAKDGLVLERPILPDGYTELEYIETQKDDYRIDIIQGEDLDIAVNSTNGWKMMFQQVSQSTGITAVKVKAIVYDDGTEWVKYRVYGVDAEGEEYLYNEVMNTSSWQQYWSITITGAVAGDEFEFVRTGFGGQYIDTGVVLDRVLSYDWDKTNGRSYNYAGVNVEINPTAEFNTFMRNGGYVKFKAQNDGMNDNFAYGLNGSYTNVASAGWIKEHFGIDITGDIVYASSDAAEAVHTVIWINRIVESPRFTIKTSAYINDREDTNLKIMGANNFYDTGTFCDLNGFENYYGWKFGRSNFNIALPVYKGWNDILISNVGTQSVNHKRCIVNGRELTMQYTGSPYYDQTISLCANHISQYTYNIINMETRLKRTTFVIDDVVAFDGVPAIRNSDGAVGLYDLANNEFKESIGANPFFAGPVKEYPTIDTKQEEIIGKNIVKGFENDTYVQLTYLESMGSQALNLGRRAYPSHAYEIRMQLNKGILSEQTLRPVFGVCGHNAGITPNYALRTKNYRLNRAVATGQSSGATFDVCGINDQWHTIRTAKTATYVDGSWVNGFSSTTDSYIDRPMALFGCNSGTNDYGPSQDEITSPLFIGKIAYFREISIVGGSNIESIVMEYIPVKRKADGKVGFYCIQTDEFFTNIVDSSTDFAEGEIFGTREVEEDTSFVLPAEFITSTIAKNSVNTNSNLSKTGQTVYGQNTKTLGEHDTIIGANAQSNSTTGQNTLVGYNAEASNDKNVCVGRYAQTTGYNTVVIGANSRIDGSCSVSIGNCRGRDSSSAYTIGNYSVSVGYGISSRGSTQSVFVGSNTGLGNLSSGNVTWGVCIGDNAQIEANYSTAIGFQAKNKNVGGVAIGPYTTNNGDYSVSIGNYWNSSAKLVSNYSIAIGFHAGATDATNSVFLGAYSTASSTNLSQMTAVGVGATTNGDNTVAVGYNASSGGAGSVVVGTASSTSSAYSISVGYQAQTTANYGVAIGYQAQSFAEDSIQLGHGTNSEAHSFYVGFTNGSVKMLDSTFVIPYERLTTATPTDGYCLMYDGNSDSLVWSEAGGSYTLPIASSSTLGGIKVGSGLSINSSTGVLSANAQALQPATANRLGGIKVGNGLSVENDGTLSADVQSNNFEDIGGDPYDNEALADALNGLQNNIDGVESDLQGQIDNLSSIGQFLAMWDCDTGTARYLTSGFVYPRGGYFIVGAIASQGQSNYMPDGSSYTGASSTVATDPVQISDMYFYDGTNWIYLANHARAIAVDHDLSTTSTNPVENRAVAEALDDKQDTLTAGNGIDITDNVISVVNNSVGVPQIANVYTKQINGQKSYEEHAQKEEYLLNYSDIMFNLNLNKDQIIEKMDDLYIGVSRYKHNRNSTKVVGQPHLDVSTDSSQITNLTGNIRTWINYWGYEEVSHTYTWISGDNVWEDENGSQWSDLGEFGITYTGTPADGDVIYANFYGMMEIDVRNKIKFNLMNDKYVPLDQKMYCYRFETSDITSSTTDPRHWKYFYIPEDASSWAYEDWVNNNPSLYMFCGHWSVSNYAKCLNALGSTLVFSDIDNGFAPERYEDGDIDRFVVVGKDSIINDGYASLMRCRAYDDNGDKVYAWCADWNDGGESVYMTQTPTIIPDSYVGTLEDVGTVSSFEADKTFLERRDDLNYWSLQTGNYSVADFADYLRDSTFNSVYEWFPQADPDRSTTPAWSCYWLDYPIQPVLLRDCEVLTQKTVSNGHRDYERGSWIKLKDLVSKGITDALEDGMPVQFRYPLNTAEMWLRFGAWQKRCLYNDEYEFDEDGQKITLYTTPALKNSLADCWKIPDEKLLLTKKAFGRQRGGYNAWNQHTKVSEYIQFNLYTPANITMGTQTSSTAVKTKLTINVYYGDSCLRD